MKKWILLLMFLVGCSTTVPEKEESKPEVEPPVVVMPEPTPTKPPVVVMPEPTPGETSKRPSVNSTWALSYYGKFVDYKVDYYILDLWAYNPKELPKHTKYIAYFSLHFEDWRPDADQFNKSWMKKWDEWDGEYLVEPKHFSKMIPIMKKRIDLAEEKGFIGVDFDNVDQPWIDNTSSKAYKDAKSAMAAYWNELAAYAKSKGMIVSQKNASRYSDVLKDPDFYQVEQCHEYNECDSYTGKGKAVFVLEYQSGNCKPYPGAYIVYKKGKKMTAEARKVCN